MHLHLHLHTVQGEDGSGAGIVDPELALALRSGLFTQIAFVLTSNRIFSVATAVDLKRVYPRVSMEEQRARQQAVGGGEEPAEVPATPGQVWGRGAEGGR